MIPRTPPTGYLVTLFNIGFPSKRLCVGELKLNEREMFGDDREKFFTRKVLHGQLTTSVGQKLLFLCVHCNILHLIEEIHWICSYGRIVCHDGKSPEAWWHHEHWISSLLEHHLHLWMHHLTLMHHLKSTRNLS